MTEDANGYIFYEAKFCKEPVNRIMIENEIRQVRAAGLNCYKYGFISRSDFAAEPEEDEVFVGLGELYGELTFCGDRVYSD